MGVDEDDEGFGDFKFADFPNATVSNRSNARSLSPEEDDDDWGDFVDHSNRIGVGFGPANGFSHIEPSPKPSETPKSTESFGFQAAGLASEKNQWVKPQGALPLSIFGEEEEEAEEEAVTVQSVVDGSMFGARENHLSRKDGDSGTEGSNLNGGVGINDIIATLYRPNQQIKVENGSSLLLNNNGSNVNFGFDPLKFNPPSNLSSRDLDSNGSNSSANVSNVDLGLSNSLTTPTIEQNLNRERINSDVVSGGTNFDEDENDDGWEFMAADSVTPIKNEISKEQLVTDSSQLKGEGTKQEDQKIQENAFGFGNGTHISANLFVPSSGFAKKTDKWNFGFDLDSNSVARGSFFSDSHSRTEQDSAEIGSSPLPLNENGDSDENIWEFKDAFSEKNNTLEDPRVANLPRPYVEAPKINGDGSYNPNNSFFASNGISHKSHEWSFGFDVNPDSGVVDHQMSDANVGSTLNSTGKELDTSQVVGNNDVDENPWEFKDAYSENGLRQKGEPVAADNSPSDVVAQSPNAGIQISPLGLVNTREALPLSIFSDGDIEMDDSHSNSLDFFPTMSETFQKSNSHNHGANVSISNFISTLYGEAGKTDSANHTPKENVFGTHTTSTIFQSRFLDCDDDFMDDSWEFKDASSVIEAQDETSVKIQGNEYVNFYCKFKNGLCLLADGHLDKLKKAQSTATLSGEDGKAKAIEEEIKKFSGEVNQENVISEDFQSENVSTGEACLNDLLEQLRDSRFQVLETEYNLSERLLLAEKDSKSAIELLKHVVSTLRILTWRSSEEQSNYVSLWHKMLSTCLQELKHGALIWKESLQKKVEREILSEPQGKKYILALGEIYRVVEVLGASARLYKPWMLSSDHHTNFSLLVNECSALWSSSGFSEALLSVSGSTGFESEALLDSIKNIQNLDISALQNSVLSGKQDTCRLSALPADAAPDIKMIIWNGESCFVKLANLWANLICPDPPFPHMNGYV